jgi:hypothetical protein
MRQSRLVEINRFPTMDHANTPPLCAVRLRSRLAAELVVLENKMDIADLEADKGNFRSAAGTLRAIGQLTSW